MTTGRRRQGPLYRETVRRILGFKRRFHVAKDKVRLGRIELGELLSIGVDYEDNESFDRLDAWTALLDELIVYFSYRTMYLVHFLPKEQPDKNKAIALSLLVSGLGTDLLAIRQCAQQGPVTAAYALSRSVIERVDVVCLLIEHPELIDEFIDQDHSHSLNFWRKHISGGKARRARLKFVARNLGGEAASAAAKYASEDFGIYSMAVHPSAPMAMASLFGAANKPDLLYWPAFLRKDADGAIRPLSAAIEYGVEFVVALKVAQEEGWTFLTPSDESDYVHQRVQELELLMFGVMARFSQMRQDKRYLPGGGEADGDAS